MTVRVPGFFGDKDAGERIGELGIFLERNPKELTAAVLFGLGRLELVDVIAFIGEERKRPGLRCVIDRQFQNSVFRFGPDGDGRNPDGYLAADFVEEALQVHVVLRRGGHRKIEAGFSGETDFLANEPFEIHRNRQFLGQNQIRGRGDFRQQDGLRLIAVTDQRGGEDFFRKRKMQRTGGVALGQSPVNGGGHAGVAGIFPVNVPTGLGPEAQADGKGPAR